MVVMLCGTAQQISPGEQHVVPQQVEVGAQMPAPGGGVQGGTLHWPPEQYGVLSGQTLSHVPQWCGSFPRFTHKAPQQLKPRLHVVELQLPDEPPVPAEPPEPGAPPEAGEPPLAADPPEAGTPPLPGTPPLEGDP